MSIVRLLTVLLLGCLLTSPARAWGPLGHAVVAELAERQLDPRAEAEVRRLLAPEGHDRLAQIASWADEIQDDPSMAALWRETRALHYVNFPRGNCHYEPPRDCPDGRCVVGALAHYTAVLADAGRSDDERRNALKFVVHFVGDVHQPLHAGWRDDKGGNTYQVQFAGKGSNLHRVWDSGLLATRGLDMTAYADALAAAPAPLASSGAFAAWAEASCRIVATPGFYPDGHFIDEAYVERWRPVAEQRLREAGQRLAEVLDRALAP